MDSTNFNPQKFQQIEVKFASKKNPIKVERFKDGHIPEVKEFDFAVVDLGHTLDHMKNYVVPAKDRILKSNKNVRILKGNFPYLEREFQKVTKLANLPSSSYLDEEKRFEYQHCLYEVYKIMAEEIQDGCIKDTLGILLERGSLLVGAFYDFPKNNIARIVAKRLDKRDGTFGVGLSNLRLPPNVERFKKLHIQEDCIASGDSISGVLLALKKGNIFFEQLQIDCFVATQPGIEFLLRFLPYLGIKKILIKTGSICYGLNEHYYLVRTEEEGYFNGEYYVGDMGEWSKKLSATYDKKAEWNTKRLD